MFFCANNNFIFISIYFYDIKWFFIRNFYSSSLANSIINYSIMNSNYFSIYIFNVSFRKGIRSKFFNYRSIITIRNKTNVLTIWLVRNIKDITRVSFFCKLPNGNLRKFSCSFVVLNKK